MPKTITIYGNYGELIASVRTGKVTEYRPESEDDKEYAAITQIDVREYENAYHQKLRGGEVIDILDVGYHYINSSGDSCYEPCIKERREERSKID
jgi:hypothetical protein